MPMHPIDPFPLEGDIKRYFDERGTIALDADDVKALRAANDHVALFWGHGFGYIRAVRKGEIRQGFRTDDAQRFIPYGEKFDLHSRTTQPGFCVQIIHCSNGNEARQWHTIAGSLRVGDHLIVRWAPDNMSSEMRARGETSDECWLEVWPQGNQEKRKVYLLDKWFGAATHQHRMCRGAA